MRLNAAWGLAFALAATVASAGSPDARVVFPASVQQGSLVFGKVPPGSVVRYGERTLRTTPYGTVVFGVGRDQAGTVEANVTTPDGRTQNVQVAVTPRDWPIEQVRGVPPATVEPPPEIAARIEREQAQVTAARD